MTTRLTESRIRKIIREEILRESSGNRLMNDIMNFKLQRHVKRWGPDIAAVYLSLPVDMSIEKVARKLRAVRESLGSMSPAEAYEIDPAALRDAIRSAGLSGPRSDRFRDPADRYY